MDILSFLKENDYIFELLPNEGQDYSKVECRQELANHLVGAMYGELHNEEPIFVARATDAGSFVFYAHLIWSKKQNEIIEVTRISFVENAPNLVAVLDKPWCPFTAQELINILDGVLIAGHPLAFSNYWERCDVRHRYSKQD